MSWAMLVMIMLVLVMVVVMVLMMSVMESVGWMVQEPDRKPHSSADQCLLTVSYLIHTSYHCHEHDGEDHDGDDDDDDDVTDEYRAQ